jgi:hypothetical protein
MKKTWRDLETQQERKKNAFAQDLNGLEPI